MKTFITLIIVLITLNCNAQYSKAAYKCNYGQKTETFKDIVIPVSILATTFVTVEYMLQNDMNKQTGSIISLTGMVTSATSYFVIKLVKKNTPKKIQKRRRKRFSRL